MRFRLSVATVALTAAASVAADPPKSVSYHKDVLPIFRQVCLGCHQPAKAQAGYIMTDFAAMVKGGETGKPAIVPGKPDASHLVENIRVVNGHHEMPKNRDPLTAPQIAIIETWVKEGAKDDTPPAAKGVTVDADHPPAYLAAPVVTSLAYSPDGSLLAATGYHEILLHKADGSGLAGRLIGESERVQSLAFSPDGKRLAAAAGSPGRFGEIQIWDVVKKKLIVSAPATFDTVYGASWSPDGKLVAFGCGDNTVRAIDASNGKQVLFMGTHSDWVLGTAFSRDGLHLVSVSRDMTVKLTEVATQRFIDNVTSITPGALKGGLMTLDVRPVTTKKTTKVPLDDGGKTEEKPYDELVVAGSDGTPRLYKFHRETKRVIGDDANKIKQFDPLPGRVSCVRFDLTGAKFAATSSLDGKGEVRVYEVESGKVVKCESVSGPAYTVAWRADGKQLASAGFDGTVWLHDPATGKLMKAFPVAPTGVAAK